MSRYENKKPQHRPKVANCTNFSKNNWQTHPIPYAMTPPPGLYPTEPARVSPAYQQHMPKKSYGYQSTYNHRPQYPGPPGLHHRAHPHPSYFGADEGTTIYMKKPYVKQYQEYTPEKLSSCSTGSSEEDNQNHRPPRPWQKDRTFVVYHEGAPIYEGEPTEDDTKTLIYSFIRKNDDKFCCSELKNGPCDVGSIPLPSFADL